MIQTTATYKFEMPDNSEPASQLPFNRNFNKLDTEVLPLYLLKTEFNALNLDTRLTNVESVITGLPTNYVSTTTFTNYQNTISQEFNKYSTTTQMYSVLSDYVLTTALNSTLSNYVTTTNLNATLQGYVQIQGNDYVTNSSLSTTLNGYAKKTDLNDYVQTSTLSDYAKKAELSGYVTVEEYNKLEARVKALEEPENA